MGVYLYPSGTETELKNAYIGEVYEYSYDFRNKTSSNLTADGWTIVKGTPSFGTYGVYGWDVRLTRSISLTNANKLSLKFLCTSYTQSSSEASIALRVAASVTSSGSTGSTGSYIDANANQRQVNIYGTTTQYSGLSNGTYTQNAVFDFVNKTYTLTTTGKSTETGTLTDTQISNIKNNITVIYCFTSHTNSNGGLATINVTVEY